MTERGGGAGLKKNRPVATGCSACPAHSCPSLGNISLLAGGEGPMKGTLPGPYLLPFLNTGIGSKVCSLPKLSQSEPFQDFSQSFQRVSNLKHHLWVLEGLQGKQGSAVPHSGGMTLNAEIPGNNHCHELPWKLPFRTRYLWRASPPASLPLVNQIQGHHAFNPRTAPRSRLPSVNMAERSEEKSEVSSVGGAGRGRVEACPRYRGVRMGVATLRYWVLDQ